MSSVITSFPALICFAAAAELQSFSKAADRLNRTHGAVSRAIRLLEADLGVALFLRRNRAVFLTDEGRELAQAVQQGLGQIETAARRIQQSRRDAPVTLSCEPTLLMRWLIPRMPSFHAQYPDAEIHLQAGGGPVHLGAGITLAIRRNDFDWPARYWSESLFDEEIGPVCRPDRAAAFLSGAAPSPDAPLLHSRTRPSAWETWCQLQGQDLSSNPAQHYDHFYFSLQAAVAGLGLAIGPWYLVQDDLKSGFLTAPLGFRPDGSSYHLLANEAPKRGSAAASFREWLIATIAAGRADA